MCVSPNYCFPSPISHEKKEFRRIKINSKQVNPFISRPSTKNNRNYSIILDLEMQNLIKIRSSQQKDN